MSSTTLRKITTQAKKIRKKHPAMQWKTAVKKAGADYRAGKIKNTRKAKNRQTGKSNRKIDRKRKARRPGPRIPRRGSQVTYVERRANRSDVPGTLEGVSISAMKSAMKARIIDKIDKAVVRKYHAKGKRIKRRIQKTITAAKVELRKFC